MEITIHIPETAANLLRLLQTNDARRITNQGSFEVYELVYLMTEGYLKQPSAKSGRYALTPLGYSVWEKLN